MSDRTGTEWTEKDGLKESGRQEASSFHNSGLRKLMMLSKVFHNQVSNVIRGINGRLQRGIY